MFPVDDYRNVTLWRMKSWRDWEGVERAVYKVQWFADTVLAQMISSAIVLLPGVIKNDELNTD